MMRTCPKCGGRKQVQSPLTFELQNCPACHGAGTVPEQEMARQVAPREIEEQRIQKILFDVRVELERANKLHPAFHSTHEGYAVLQEEVEELWEGVRRNADDNYLRREAEQIAAMAVRFILDLRLR